MGNRRSHSSAFKSDKGMMMTTSQKALRKTINLETLTLASYIRLCTLISICIGVAASIAFFFLDVLGVNMTYHWGFISIEDTESGILALFVGPFVFGVTGFVGSLLSYQLFLRVLRRFWGITLTGTWTDPEEPNNQIMPKPRMSLFVK